MATHSLPSSANDFGGKLRQARERRGISLRQIAASTKIAAAALEALERNDISKLPGGIFSRAFVRSYAVEVGLNPEETVREFLDRFQGEPAPSAASAPVLSPQETSFESRRRIALIWIVLVTVIAGSAIAYFTIRWRGARGQTITTPNPPAPPAQTQAVVPTAAAVAPAASVLTLDLHPTGRCWVSLTIDGVRVVAREMQPGDRETHRVATAALLEVGDAGVFAFSINGRPGKSLGSTGQKKTARISSDTMAEYVK